MVFFYTLPPKAHARGFRVYMGRDKFENEQLLAHGWENDVWFHVDNLSSAHVYLRLPEGDNACTWEEIPPIVMKYCCQLVKNNSIEGCKKKECFVIYTPFANLHKDVNTMQTGAVSFHDEALRIRVRVEKDRELAKKIEKTKEDQGDLDFAALKAEHDQVVLRKLKKERMSSEARVSHLQRNVERLGELRREFETSQAQLRAATAALEEETAGRAKEVARAAKWKQRAFALSKQMLELSSVPPLRDESGGGGGGGGRETGNGSGARHAHSRSSARRQNDPETPAAGGNSMMWSASANMDWKGGAGVGARISGLDPPHMQRVRGAGPGRTTLLKPKMLQSLPTLRGPERGSRGTEMVRDGSAPMFKNKHHITGR